MVDIHSIVTKAEVYQRFRKIGMNLLDAGLAETIERQHYIWQNGTRGSTRYSMMMITAADLQKLLAVIRGRHDTRDREQC